VFNAFPHLAGQVASTLSRLRVGDPPLLVLIEDRVAVLIADYAP
jgi:hypothetical protein